MSHAPPVTKPDTITMAQAVKAVKGFKKQVAGEDGWSEWVSPTPKAPYQMACCDCGLVHDLEFNVYEVAKQTKNGWWHGEPFLKPFRVLLRARRNERQTAAIRARDAA